MIAPFALFSNLVSDIEKKQIASQLLRMKEDIPLKLGIPRFPHLAAATKLSSLIGKQSWLLFQGVRHQFGLATVVTVIVAK